MSILKILYALSFFTFQNINTIEKNNDQVVQPFYTENADACNFRDHTEKDKINAGNDLENLQKNIDNDNSKFWNELCGTPFAQSIGVTDNSESCLKKLDSWYFSFYPYLKDYLDQIPRKKVLEIGLGYGTISTYLANRSDQYYGLDIAQGPVDIVNQRLKYLDKEPTAKIGSVHSIPFDNDTFDGIVSIGCFHHTGNVQKCIDEAYRVLKPGGVLLFMCYNKRSFRMLKKMPFSVFFNTKEQIRLSQSGAVLYDTNSQNNAAPFTEVSSADHYRKMCTKFSSVSIKKENWEGLDREKKLNNIAEILGLDLYIVCIK